mgnify:CR=1 FL=1
MSQVIQIKRTAGAVGNKTLHQGELAYSQADDKLYIGNDMADANAHAPVAIGGVAFTDMLAPADTTNSASVVLGDADKTASVTLTVPTTLAASYNLTLPSDDGDADEVLSTNGSGVLSWTATTSSVEDASDTTIASATAADLLVYKDATDGWSNVAVSGDATIANTGVLSLSDTGKEAVQVYIEASDDLTLAGNLTVNGTTTTVNSTTLEVDDKNIELGTVDTPTDTTANGGGITLKGTSDKTLLYTDATKSWDFNQSLKLAQTAPTGNNASLATALTIEDKVFGTVTQSTDGAGAAQANTYTLGSAGIEYDGDTISLAKGGTGLTTLAKGSIFYGSDTNVVDELTSASASLTGTQSGLLSLAADNTISWTTTVDGGSW